MNPLLNITAHRKFGIKQDFRYFKEGKGEEKSFLRAKLYLIKHYTAYIRLQEIFSMVSVMSSFEDEHVLQRVCRTKPSFLL